MSIITKIYTKDHDSNWEVKLSNNKLIFLKKNKFGRQSFQQKQVNQHLFIILKVFCTFHFIAFFMKVVCFLPKDAMKPVHFLNKHKQNYEKSLSYRHQ